MGEDPGDELLGQRRTARTDRRDRGTGSALPPVSQTLKWMWAPLPAWSGHGFGASDATRPYRAATPRIVSRTSTCVSAAASAGRWQHRQLVLAVTELRVVLGDRDALRVERADDGVDDLGGGGHPDRREARARVDRDEPTVLQPGQRRTRSRRRSAARCPARPRRATMRARNWRGQASYGARSRRDVVDEHHRRARRVRDHGERRRVGHQSDLADRAHSVDGLELVERVHRLHRDGEPDAGASSAAARCSTDTTLPRIDPAVVAVQEAHQPHVRIAARSDDLVGGGHAHRWCFGQGWPSVPTSVAHPRTRRSGPRNGAPGIRPATKVTLVKSNERCAGSCTLSV